MTTSSPKDHARSLREQRATLLVRQAGYRERALKLFPHVCTSCGRSFDGKRLKELTVHHKDHNWKNNPPDGSNWELLCLFCHDHEHERYKLADYHGGMVPVDGEPAASVFSPFESLDSLITPADDTADSGKKQDPA